MSARRRKPAPKRAQWFRQHTFGFRYAYCPDAKTWASEMAILGLPGEPFPTTHGRCVTSTNTKGETVCIVTISATARERGVGNLPGLIGLVLHEAVHVWQHLCDDIGEENPSPEFEAYTVQDIAADLLHAVGRCHGIKELKP